MKRRLLSIMLALIVVFTCVIPGEAAAASVWIPMTSNTRLAFWGQNATVSQVCDAIVASLNSQAEEEMQWTSTMIIGILGFGTLSALATYTDGCYVKYESFYFQITGQPIQYLYQVTLLDSSFNVMHGPFRYQPNPYVASVPEEEDQLN